jgi:hypothetical protein
MNIELFALCDAAADYNGKLSILGAFDAIWARTAPAVHPQCAVALRMRFSKVEEGEHKVKINIVDADGKSVVKPFETTANIRYQENINSIAANMILNLHGIKFTSFGDYSIDLTVNGKHEASLPLYVNQLPAQA